MPMFKFRVSRLTREELVCEVEAETEAAAWEKAWDEDFEEEHLVGEGTIDSEVQELIKKV